MRIRQFKSFRIITFGCRVNQAESRMMGEGIAKQFGGQNVDIYKKADLVVINTCCVTGKAEKEVRKEIRRVKRENPECFLAVCGCWVDRIKNLDLPVRPAGLKIKSVSWRIKSKIDLLINNKDKKKIGEILRKKFIITKIRLNDTEVKYLGKYGQYKKAMVKIQEGCDNFCSYCIVPWVRGRSKSRSADKIIKEVKEKVNEGIEEIILTGTDIEDYKLINKNMKRNLKTPRIKNHLVQLIKVILKKTKVKKISFGSMGLKIFSKEFIDLYNDDLTKNRLSAHFHIPLQSGCDKTLKRMKRRYKVSEFIKTIQKIKELIPDSTFSTDIIVGFPGEKKREFERTFITVKKLKKILGKRFTKAHIFRFSQRDNTVAAKMLGQPGWEKVAENKKKARSTVIKNCLGSE